MFSYNKYMQDIFIRFGLTEKESAAFLELVRLGACPVSRWATYAGINRSSMYVLLDRLKAQGLVTSTTHHGVTYVQSVPMAEVSALLFDKQQSLERTHELFLARLPELQKLEKNHGLTPKVSFYEGTHRVEEMYEHVMKEKSFNAYFHPARIQEMMPEYFHTIPQTLKKHGGSAKELLIACKEADQYKKLYASDTHHIRILPKQMMFSSDTIITDQKIFLVGYSENSVVATEIWNEALARTQSAIFDTVWNATAQ